MQINIDTAQIRQKIAENPLVAAGIGAAVLKGCAELMNANTKRANAKTWRKEVNRRDRKKS